MYKLHCLIIVYITCTLQCFAQDESSIRRIINAGDLKKLEKADTYKKDADKLIEEANSLNMEVFSVQADETLNEKARTKKVSQLEDQAQQKQIESSGLYEKSNEIRFTLYKQYIDDFWKTHEGKESDYLNAKLLEEQSSDNYFQAVSYRIEAKKMDAFARVEKLNEATNLEMQAIQKQVTALCTYYGINQETTPPEPSSITAAGEITPSTVNVAVSDSVYTPIVEPTVDQSEQIPVLVTNAPVQPETTMSSGIAINQSMIDSYNRYIATGQFTDTTLSTGKIAGVTSFDSDNLLQLWYEYIYGRNAVTQQPDSLIAEKNESADNSTIALNDTAKGSEIGIVTDENLNALVPADENVIYRVQIAANRNELSQRALSRMYYGNKNVEMINEGGWYKYSVGDFTTYDEAAKFRKASGMNNAFVVAYRKGTRFNKNNAEEKAVEEIVSKAYSPAGSNKLPSGLIFRIQVAACRVPMTVNQLKAIYTGTYPLEMVSEDGWYKYQFMGVRLYSDALQIIRSVTTKGVFIVAYEDGIKIDLGEAVKKNKELEKTVKMKGRKGIVDEIEFHLQLAASRVPMHEEELKSLYKGSEPVSVIYEDGWYKYHLKAGNSPQEAEQFRSSCGVPKAFIVTYKRAAKIGLFQALQELQTEH